ncbi:F-box domain-containing protein [Mycena venus]|uniref:F-box domain-containing protein n=1 Tax=Mycena venus TaxID=2733690 RepID=A0A8H6X537_9AGAR|nr:F-box domain-containing protein [Mycena venus]
MASTAFNRIPDEIVSEILTPLLKHPDKVFADRSEQPLLAPGYSSSTYLLVCKVWLRVSTPLLYNVVILRTTAQAEALQTVLQSNKEFGLFIKKLRVEGGFGNPMQTILKCAPNITDLFLTFFVWSSDSVRGLCSGLALINPRRVIVVDADGWDVKLKENKQVTQLFNSLLDLIPKWDNLKIFEFPYLVRGEEMHSYPKVEARAAALASALAESPSLETLVADIGLGLPDYIYRVAKAPSLKSIHFMLTVRSWAPQIREAVKKYPTLEALVTYGTKEGPLSVHDILIAADPPFPSQSESRSRSSSPPAEERWKKSGGHIIEELRVDFLDQLVFPGSKSKIESVDCAVLASFTSLTRLTWGAHERMLLSSPPPGFSALDNLQMLSIDGESPSLLDIALHQRLDSLRELRLGRQVLVPAAIALLRSRAAQLTHLTALVEILREVDVFELCTSLNTLSVILPWTKVADKLARNALPEDFLTRSTPHNTLEKICFEFHTLNRDEPALKHIFEHLDPASFPALKEIQLDCIKWPNSEQQARKNKWIPFSELLRPKGIKLTDSKGLGGTRHIK